MRFSTIEGIFIYPVLGNKEINFYLCTRKTKDGLVAQLDRATAF